MTMWEYTASMDGWNKAQAGGYAHQGDPMTDAEYDALCALGDRWNNGDS